MPRRKKKTPAPACRLDDTASQFAGYFLVEAGSFDQAVDIAGRIPGARLGGVEVRQLIDIEGLPESA